MKSDLCGRLFRKLPLTASVTQPAQTCSFTLRLWEKVQNLSRHCLVLGIHAESDFNFQFTTDASQSTFENKSFSATQSLALSLSDRKLTLQQVIDRYNFHIEMEERYC
jgi:hypothetical protein